MITAHSGSDGYLDNSREFIDAMLNSSVEAFEIDCQLGVKETLYLSHDTVEDYQDCLTLDDVFQMMKDASNQEIILNIDCKNDKIGPLAVNLARKHQLLNRIVLSGSLKIEDYAESFRKQLFYNLDNSLSYDENTSLYDLEIVLEKLENRGIKIVQSYYGLVNQEMLTLINKYNIELSVWTVNELKLIEDYLKLGCYNVTSRTAQQYLNNLEVLRS